MAAETMRLVETQHGFTMLCQPSVSRRQRNLVPVQILKWRAMAENARCYLSNGDLEP